MFHRPGLIVLAIVMTLGAAELGARLVASALPDPAPWPTLETRVKNLQMEASGCVDMVFLGTSVTEAAVITDRFESSAYNAALPFSTQGSTRLWAESFVLPLLCPEVVVIGLPVWSPAYILAPQTRGRLHSGLGQVIDFREPAELHRRLLYRSELVRRRSQLKELGDLLDQAEEIVGGGLWSPTGHQTGHMGRQTDGFPPVDYSIAVGRETDLAILRALVIGLVEQGRRVVLLIEPSRCSPFGECLSGKAHAELTSIYSTFAVELDIPVIDVQWGFAVSDYADPAHLNSQGAEKFTSAVRRALLELGIPS